MVAVPLRSASPVAARPAVVGMVAVPSTPAAVTVAVAASPAVVGIVAVAVTRSATRSRTAGPRTLVVVPPAVAVSTGAADAVPAVV